MDRYVIEKIKEYKLKNDVNSSCLIHEYYVFEHNGKKYVNIYVKCLNGCKNVEINNKFPITSRYLDDDVVVLCYLYDDVKDNMIVTEYGKEKIKNNNLILPDDYDTDSNNVAILSSLNLKGFKQVNVVPKTTEKYWICACGTANEDNFCKTCGAKKEFSLLYDTEEKIHKRFALKEYEKNKFKSENIEEEIKLFKEKIKKNKKYKINLSYLDKDFFDNIEGESNYKAEVYKNKKSNNSLIKKYIIIILIALALLYVAGMIISSLTSSSRMKEIVSKNCESAGYSKARSLKSVISDGRCGSLIYFLEHSDFSNSELEELVNSNNIDLYKGYYSYKKENIHQTMEDSSIIRSDEYLKYLYDNEFETVDKAISYKLSEALINKDKEKFTNYSKYLSIGNKEWEDDFSYFEHGYDKVDPETYNYEVGMEKNAKNYTEFSLIYHQESGDYSCNRADLYSADNLKLLFEKKDNKVCQYSLSNTVADMTADELQIYINAKGSLDYNSYLGNMIHHLVDDYYISNDIASFEAKLKLLNVNGAINQQMKSDSADPGFTPLDTFIEKNYNTCKDAQSKYNTNANKVKSCNAYKTIYAKMKNLGAKCNKQCSSESVFK